MTSRSGVDTTEKVSANAMKKKKQDLLSVCACLRI